LTAASPYLISDRWRSPDRIWDLAFGRGQVGGHLPIASAREKGRLDGRERFGEGGGDVVDLAVGEVSVIVSAVGVGAAPSV
jgi:hypothetical protein